MAAAARRPGRALSPRALSLRAALIATPVFLAACAVPDGGLFRGRTFRDLRLYQVYGDALLHGRIPYRDFPVEYPPGALPLFAAVSLAPGGFYQELFKAAMAACGLAAIFSICLVLAASGAGRARVTASALGLALTPIALGPVSLNTYDAWPAALVAGALAALVYRRPALGLGLLAAAAAAKLYAIVLVPLALVWLGRRALPRAAAAFAGTTAVLAAPWLALSPGGVWDALQAQIGRGLHAESLGASVLLALDRAGAYEARVVRRAAPAVTRDVAGSLAGDVATASSILAVAAAGAVLVVFLARRGDLGTAFAATVGGVLAFAKVLSPQYLVWLIPLVPLAGGWLAPALLLGALAVAQSWYFEYPELWAEGPQVWRLLARNLLLVGLYGVLLWKTSTPSSSNTSSHRGFRRNRTRSTADGIGARRSA